ncbi:hypothetical protein M3Y96_00320300 [Aphelenchoides besseyi]|nr:hypothetical protein M3Y96_00320300 [Aphelenchoides besseyi]
MFSTNEMSLKTKRNVFYMSSCSPISMCRANDNNGRFVFISDFPDHFVLDAFQGVENLPAKFVFRRPHSSVRNHEDLRSSCHNYLVHWYFRSQGLGFDVQEDRRKRRFGQPEVFVTDYPRLLCTRGFDSMRVLKLELNENDVSITDTINIPFRMFFTTLQSDCLYRFCGSEPRYIDKIVEYSLIDGVKREHKIEEENWSKFEVNYTNLYV